MKEEFEALNEIRNAKRAASRAGAVKILKESQVSFDPRNNGAHLIVTHGKNIIDFWPATGRWIPRSNPSLRGHGIYRMLAFLGVKPPTRF